MHRSEDSCTVIGDIDAFVLGAGSDRYKDFIHSSWAESSLYEIGNSDGSNERGLNNQRGTSLAIYPFYSLAPSLITCGRTFYLKR